MKKIRKIRILDLWVPLHMAHAHHSLFQFITPHIHRTVEYIKTPAYISNHFSTF